MTTIGEVLIDLTQTGVNDQNVPMLAANPGGAPANVAVAAARLGAQTAFCGKVGRDGFGSYLSQVLQENGVNVSGLHTSKTPTTMAVVTLSQEGERSFRFVRGADVELCPEEIDIRSLANTKVLHFGSVSLTAGAARSATIFAARQARQQGVLVSYDPNYRASLWESEENAVEWMRNPLPLVDLIKLSEEELPLLTGTADPETASRYLEELGIQLVLITMGEKGAFYRWQGKTGVVPGVATSVADTNGAGDTFLGAALSRLTARGDRPLEKLTAEELEKVLAFANRAASITCSRSGAIPAMPTLDELEEE
ncbi:MULTISPECIES: carbohydrate kinase family protein [unclassified Allofournierella]|uniref:carbohydrate kinase family protein n=1 Tax=unclassified Allofournierella TaxID=2633662 RepID=UPI0022EB2AB4|nr:carbohydrate kinase [Fournierella sp. CML151]